MLTVEEWRAMHHRLAEQIQMLMLRNDLESIKDLARKMRMGDDPRIDIDAMSMEDAKVWVKRLHSKRIAQEALAATQVDPRPIQEILASANWSWLPDGRLSMSLPKEPKLSPFPRRHHWRPTDVVAMREGMSHFSTTAFGAMAAHESLAVRELDSSAPSCQDRLSWTRAFWSDPALMLVLADTSFLDMAEAAALSAPTGPVHADELLAERGVIFFQEPRVLPGQREDRPSRALLWSLDDVGTAVYLNIELMCDGHHEGGSPGQRMEPPEENYYYLYTTMILHSLAQDPGIGGDKDARFLSGLLRSLAAIARSPATSTQEREYEHRRKKNGRVRSIVQAPVRTLSLRRAEHGRYELDAASGRGVRQHWVRGHWRQQWYPRLQDRRSIWIDGFIKGDPSLGKVEPRPTVHLAKGDPAEEAQMEV